MSSYHTTSSRDKVHYLQSGNPSGQLVVCLHGLGASTATFAPLVPSFPQSFNIISVDFPGFGKSPIPSRGVSIESHVADIHDLVTSLQATSRPEGQQADPIILAGHSLGSIVSLQYAARYPDNVAGLFLLSVGRAAGHIPAARQRMLDMANNVREKGIGFAADLATKTNFYEDTPERTADPKAKQAVHDAVAASDPEGYAQNCEAVVDLAHVDPDYSKITCPVVFVAGDKDLLGPISRSEDLAGLIGGEGTVCVVKSGHQPILEDLGGVKSALNIFLEKVKV